MNLNDLNLKNFFVGLYIVQFFFIVESPTKGGTKFQKVYFPLEGIQNDCQIK